MSKYEEQNFFLVISAILLISFMFCDIILLETEVFDMIERTMYVNQILNTQTFLLLKYSPVCADAENRHYCK